MTYKGIKKGGEAIVRIKGSKHLGFTRSVSSSAEVKSQLTNFKETHPKANHICYAYLLTNGEEYSSDDSEPKNTAGPPILGQIKSAGLKNVLVVVIRYFGGTKLGVPGLIQAYKSTAAEAILHSTTMIKVPTQTIRISFGYHCETLIKKLIAEFKIKLLQETYAAQIEYVMEFDIKDEKALKERINNMQDVTILN